MRRIVCMVVALILMAPATRAQLVEDALLGTVNLAYVSAQSEQTDNTTDGVDEDFRCRKCAQCVLQPPGNL